MGPENARFLPQIVGTCERVARLVTTAVTDGSLPLVLGGDHSVAIGTLGGLAQAHGPGGVLWIDAHGDLNTPATSPSGNVHGMALAAALGLAGDGFASEAWPLPSVERGRVALVGVRSLDEGERGLLEGIPVDDVSAGDGEQLGAVRVRRELLLADEAERGRVDEERGRAKRLRRRRLRAELAVDSDYRRPAVAVPQPSFGAALEVLVSFLFDCLARRPGARCDPRLDRFVRRCEGDVRELVRREVEADVREKLDRRIEEHGAVDPLGPP